MEEKERRGGRKGDSKRPTREQTLGQVRGFRGEGGRSRPAPQWACAHREASRYADPHSPV